MTQDLWLKNKGFDLVFFHLSGLLCLLLLIPYILFGDSVIFPIYSIYLVFFGLPHNYMTWATIFPKSARTEFKMEPVYATLFICLILCVLLPPTQGLDLNDWILSFISYYSFWHAYRQHQGICKMYDSVQSKRSGDFTLFNDQKILHLAFGLGSFLIIVWAFTHKEVKYLLSPDEYYRLIFPQIPWYLYQIYVAVTVGLGVWGLKKAVWDRWRAGKLIPWPQLLLMSIAIATYLVPYLFIDLKEMPLAVAIATMYHNVQYFGFVWLFERRRSSGLVQQNLELQLPQRLAYENSAAKYFGVAMGYSFLVVFLFAALPHQIGLALIYYTGIAHYIVDGYIWRRGNNTSLSGVLDQLAKKTIVKAHALAGARTA